MNRHPPALLLDTRARPLPRIAQLIVLACMLVWAARAAAVINVTLLLPDSNAPYRDAAEALRHELEQESQRWQVRIQPLAERKRPVREDLVIPLGSRALRRVLAEPGHTPVWSLLVARSEFEQIAARQPATTRRPLSALYLDQPLSRQLQMLMAALPATRRLGVLTSASDASITEPLREAAISHGLEVHIKRVTRSGDVLALLNDLKGRADILLLVPDSQVVNRSMLQPLLLETYRLRLPVMAYSTQLIGAGAMLALYTSPGKLGQEAGMRLRHAWSTAGVRLPPPAYPDSFAVAVNRSVALSLDIRVPTSERIRLRMEGNSER